FIGVIPAITGKIELVYEGEQEGADTVAMMLIDDAVKSLFPNYFPAILKLEQKDAEGPYDDLILWFFDREGIELPDDLSEAEYHKLLDSIPPLQDLISKHQPKAAQEDSYFLKEFLLWGLVVHKKLSKQRYKKGFKLKDLYGGFISKL
ncbi:MAG: magnesium chelatase, partial [Flavobacteriaceae bacterium]|nr:magnesium chelatase [Flavobacteriaceae bacterium]